MARDPKKQLSPQLLLIAAFVLFVLLSDRPNLAVGMFPLIIPALIIFFVMRAKKEEHQQPVDEANPEAPTAPAVKNDCPSAVCFHKDKGEHHVKHGKEIDPWDRPDTDISKYQHK